jgi:hypothetical protein
MVVQFHYQPQIYIFFNQNGEIAALTKTRLIILQAGDPALIVINLPPYECPFPLKVKTPSSKSRYL